jgi:hypothetical protein
MGLVEKQETKRCRTAGAETASEGNGAIVAVIAAMVLVMAVITFTLHRNSPLVANGPNVTPSEPSTSGEGGLAPVRGRLTARLRKSPRSFSLRL